MNKQYELYCLADPLFYDSPIAPQTGNLDYAIAGRPVPSGWQRFEQDNWLVFAPHDITRDVGFQFERHRNDFVSRIQFGYDGDVDFMGKEGDQSSPHQLDVLRDQ
jgi:hypothetical protein